ncbi:MAG: MFS transporter [Candidatus Thermoplasmatota archaeon]|nr:MFS transporter [Candidatus Thermoplasmatota archaeon]MCL5964104.1 MFS transporter [Candidatus Thermoplasmatota archaeon]
MKLSKKDSPYYKWVVLSNTTLAVLMAGIDTSIVVISLPYILKSILIHTPGGNALPSSSAYQIATATSFTYLLWVLMGYMLIVATLLLFFGRLADMYGRVKIYNAGFLIFTIGSFLSGFSALIIPNAIITEGIQLIIFRLLQGVGAAMMWANSVALLTDAFPPEQRGLALGTNMVSAVGGSVVGLVLGGVITASYSWRWIFIINVPIGIFATVWAYLQLHEIAQIKKGQSLDIAGALLFTSSVAMLLLGATFYTLGTMGAGATGTFHTVFYPYMEYSYIALLIFPVLLILFIINEFKYAKDPIMHMNLFRSRMYSAGVLSASLNAVGRGGVMFLLVFLLEGVHGYSAFHAGLDLIPLSLGFLIVGPISGALSDRYGYRTLTTVGLGLISLGLLILSFLPQNSSYTVILFVMLLNGIGGGLFASPNISSIMSAVQPSERGVGSAMSSTMMNIAMMLSMTIAFVFIGTSVNVTQLVTLFVGTTKDIPAKIVNSSLYQSQWISFMHAFHSVFIIFTVLLLIAMIPSILRPKGKAK